MDLVKHLRNFIRNSYGILMQKDIELKKQLKPKSAAWNTVN